MIRFTKNVLLICKNAENLSKRTLFSRQALHLEGFQKLRLNFAVKKSDSEFTYEIQHSPLPKLLTSTKLWTLRATKNDDHIDLLRYSLKRIYDNCSTIQEPTEVRDLIKLGPMTMRLFHILDLPEKALQVLIPIDLYKYFCAITMSLMTSFDCSFITNSTIVFSIRKQHRTF